MWAKAVVSELSLPGHKRKARVGFNPNTGCVRSAMDGGLFSGVDSGISGISSSGHAAPLAEEGGGSGWAMLRRVSSVASNWL